MTKDNHYFDALVSLRGLFASGIVLFHTASFFGFERGGANLLGFACMWGGYFGNCYFFVLSGFLMTHAYRGRIASGAIGFTEFLVKRIKRLYPLYLVTNIYMLIYNASVDGFLTYFRPRDMIEILFMVCSGWIDDIYPWNVPGWFVSMLILCYILWFFVAKSYQKHRDWYCLFMGVFVLWGYILIIRPLGFPFCYTHDGEGIFSFFVGAFLYDALKKIKESGLIERCIWQFVWVGGLFLLVAMSFAYGFENIMQEIQIVMNVLVMPILIFGATHWKAFSTALRLKPFSWWGRISFSVCMWHMPCLRIFTWLRDKSIGSDVLNTYVQFLLYLGLLAGISTMSFWLIEQGAWKRFVNLKRVTQKMGKIYGK